GRGARSIAASSHVRRSTGPLRSWARGARSWHTERMSQSRLVQRFVASSRSSEIAVIDARGRVSFAELAAAARALASRIEAEGLAGERLALLAPPDRSWLVGFWGALLAGSAVVPI